MNSVTLPWPPSVLSPNKRVHWSKRAKAAKGYKQTVYSLCRDNRLQSPVATGMIALWVDFVPPDRRHRDDDNLIAAFKAGRDGIALALGIDDSRFRLFPYLASDRTAKGGNVFVRLTEIPTPEDDHA